MDLFFGGPEHHYKKKTVTEMSGNRYSTSVTGCFIVRRERDVLDIG